MKTKEELIIHIEVVKEEYRKLSKEHCQIILEQRNLESVKIKKQKSLGRKQKYIEGLYKNLEDMDDLVVVSKYEYETFCRFQNATNG